MAYRVVGMGEGQVEAARPTLAAAAATAFKMIDQGVGQVRVLGEDGREIPAAEWRQAAPPPAIRPAPEGGEAKRLFGCRRFD